MTKFLYFLTYLFVKDIVLQVPFSLSLCLIISCLHNKPHSALSFSLSLKISLYLFVNDVSLQVSFPLSLCLTPSPRNKPHPALSFLSFKIYLFLLVKHLLVNDVSLQVSFPLSLCLIISSPRNKLHSGLFFRDPSIFTDAFSPWCRWRRAVLHTCGMREGLCSFWNLCYYAKYGKNVRLRHLYFLALFTRLQISLMSRERLFFSTWRDTFAAATKCTSNKQVFPSSKWMLFYAKAKLMDPQRGQMRL